MSQNFHFESAEGSLEDSQKSAKTALKQPGLVVLASKIDLKVDSEPEFTPCGLNLKDLEAEAVEGEEVWEDY